MTVAAVLAVAITSVFAAPAAGSHDSDGDGGSDVTVRREMAPAGANAAAVCVFYGKIDNAHISSTSANLAVQSHGGWINGNCKATLADVTVGIMKKNSLGIFVDVGSLGKKRLASGAWGSGQWAVGHYGCASSSTHYFQSWVDVDLVGQTDWINKTFSPPRTLGCN